MQFLRFTLNNFCHISQKHLPMYCKRKICIWYYKEYWIGSFNDIMWRSSWRVLASNFPFSVKRENRVCILLNYYIIIKNTVLYGYPKPLDVFWPRLPSPIQPMYYLGNHGVSSKYLSFFFCLAIILCTSFLYW